MRKKKEQDPEDLVRRVMRVASILLQASTGQSGMSPPTVCVVVQEESANEKPDPRNAG